MVSAHATGAAVTGCVVTPGTDVAGEVVQLLAEPGLHAEQIPHVSGQYDFVAGYDVQKPRFL